MADQPASQFCPECGNPLTPGAAQGLCPRCLMAGAAHPTQPTVSRQGSPTLEQVTMAFPQLEVLEIIGQGGMGAVYKVRQPKLDRFAALKLLPQSLAADAAFAGRFEREARLLAKLSHPNIVSVYDYGQAGDFFYLLMEYVDGVNLRQAMRASRFEPRQALGIVPKICDALQYAHEEGVLHRDIKPENILLDAKGRVKLVDFGIAKLTAEPDALPSSATSPGPAYTQAGAALGTPSYMAPEQRDHPSDVDHRADIYSLGVVFYELLTGELPTGSIPRPSEKSGADPRVDAIVQQALEKERDRRQSSAGEVRTQVETIAGPKGEAHLPILPRLSGWAIFGACWGTVFFIILALSLVAAFEQVGRNVFAIPLLPWALVTALGMAIPGWIAVGRIRESAGRLYGLGLAVFDVLLFPLLAVDGLIVLLCKQAIKFFVVEFIVRNSGPLHGPYYDLYFVEMLLMAVTSAFADFLIVRSVWRNVTKPPYRPPIKPPQNENQSKNFSLGFIAMWLAATCTALGIVACFRMPDHPLTLIWWILAAGLLAIILAIPARNTRLGKKALLVGCINGAIWLMFFTGSTVWSGNHPVPQTPPVAVTAAVVKRGDLNVYIEGLGEVAPPSNATPTSRTSDHSKSVAVLFRIPQVDVQEVIKRWDAHQLMPVDVYDANLRQKLGQGSLVGVDNQIDSTTGTLQCKAEVVPIDDTVLYPNQFINARMLVETKHNVVLAPLGASQQNPQGAFVYVIQPDQTVVTRMVKIGEMEGMTTEILNGLSPGEIVVVNGPEGLHDGAKVKWSLAPIKK